MRAGIAILTLTETCTRECVDPLMILFPDRGSVACRRRRRLLGVPEKIRRARRVRGENRRAGLVDHGTRPETPRRSARAPSFARSRQVRRRRQRLTLGSSQTSRERVRRLRKRWARRADGRAARSAPSSPCPEPSRSRYDLRAPSPLPARSTEAETGVPVIAGASIET